MSDLTEPAFTLPPPSPALQMHQAAAKLRTAAEAARQSMASNVYWAAGWAAGITNAVGGWTGDLAAILDPDTVDLIADLLDGHAASRARLENLFDNPPPPSEALPLAHAVLAGGAG